MYDTIIWDWNGTLLDDLDLSIKAVNVLLKERDLPILTLDRYKDIFDFPVINYYEKAGFDFSKEPFEIPARQYVKLYSSGESDLKLFPDVIDTLSFFKDNNYRQIVLSAMKEDNLRKMISNAGITHFFDGIFGIKDNYAREKISIGKQVVENLNLNPEKCLMIGDTLHDAEVAEQCGFDCILFSGGHVAKQRLETTGFKIIDQHKTLTSIISNT
ncbi:MAG: HAD family hydrolase [Lentimicrobiaceae bacterium]|nr:HAD family hydrolase [Lentimicrobiaceae bacterium]